MFFTSKKKKYYVGIDLGGTNIATAVVDENGSVFGRATSKTYADRAYTEILDDMVRCSIDAVSKAGLTMDDIISVGIGVPAAVDYANGTVSAANNIPSLNDKPIRDYLSSKLNKNVYLENDANAAAWGEYLFGSGKGVKNFAMITLGTGIGGAMIIDGKIYVGLTGDTAEFGHMVINLNGNNCSCGRRGCFETYSSATALIKQTKEKMKEYPDSEMWKICGGKLSNVNGETPFKAKKDKAAKEVIDNYLFYLSEGILNVINAADPDVLCIGGGVSNAGDKLLKPIVRKTSKYLHIKNDKKQAEIKIAELNNDAGILGAALIWKNFEKK